MSAPFRKLIVSRGRVRSVLIEQRPIARKKPTASPARKAIPAPSGPALLPLAADVRRVLAGGPTRFPDTWWQ